MLRGRCLGNNSLSAPLDSRIEYRLETAPGNSLLILPGQPGAGGSFPAYPILTKASEIRIVRGLSNDVMQESFLGKFSTSNQARTTGGKSPAAEHQSAFQYAHFHQEGYRRHQCR
jgi:hypothetical protein